MPTSTSTTTTIVGIDVGDEKVAIEIQPSEGKPIKATIARLEAAAWITERLAPGELAIIALELTGSLALPILDQLEPAGHQLMIAQDTDSHALRRLLRRPRKRDDLDANLLVRIARLALNPDSADIVARHIVPWPQVARAVRARTAARYLIALTREDVRCQLRLRVASTPEQRADLTATRAILTQQIAAAEARMLDQLHPAAELLTTLPKLGRRRAAILDAAIGDVERFTTADKLVRYLARIIHGA